MRIGVPNEKEWLSTKEVAKYLGVGPITIQRWCGSEYLMGVKIGKSWRIHRDELEDLLKRSETTLENPE
jgi:excisionase family DNA binding protein